MNYVHVGTRYLIPPCTCFKISNIIDSLKSLCYRFYFYVSIVKSVLKTQLRVAVFCKKNWVKYEVDDDRFLFLFITLSMNFSNCFLDCTFPNSSIPRYIFFSWLATYTRLSWYSQCHIPISTNILNFQYFAYYNCWKCNLWNQCIFLWHCLLF